MRILHPCCKLCELLHGVTYTPKGTSTCCKFTTVHWLVYAEVGTWLPSTAALLAYAAANALTATKAVSLMAEGAGQEALAVQGGMAVVALLAGALVYDNAMLASGRFLGQVHPFSFIITLLDLPNAYAPSTESSAWGCLCQQQKKTFCTNEASWT